MPDDGPISRDLQAAMAREQEARIVWLLKPYRQRRDVKHGVLMGSAFLDIIRAVLRNKHDLVIKCPESPSWLDRFFFADDMHRCVSAPARSDSSNPRCRKPTNVSSRPWMSMTVTRQRNWKRTTG